jgi:hypothetical protein
MGFSEQGEVFEGSRVFGDNLIMRTVGQPRHNTIPSPQEAWERGRVLDAMLPSLRQQRPHGVWRLSHIAANQMDDELMQRTAEVRFENMRAPHV